VLVHVLGYVKYIFQKKKKNINLSTIPARIMHRLNRMMVALLSLVLLVALPSGTEAGPIAYGICQSGCAALVVACYASAGLVFGTVTAGLGKFPIKMKIE
jgi:hypothetical protein